MDDTRTLIDAAAEHLRVAEPFEIEGMPHLMGVSRQDDTKVDILNLEEHLAAPRRIRQQAKFETPESFAAYVNAFGDRRTRIFASLEKREVRAIIDYHRRQEEPTESDWTGPEMPSWRTHVAAYPAVFDPQFAAWAAVDGRPLPQKEFAGFLEDRAEDCVAPDPADMMEVAAKFEAVRNVNFISAVNVNTGERAFKYEEKDAPAGAITVPKAILLRTPIFQGTDPVDWKARLAYDINGGALTFTVKIHRLTELLNAAFDQLCLTIVDGTGHHFAIHRGVAL